MVFSLLPWIRYFRSSPGVYRKERFAGLRWTGASAVEIGCVRENPSCAFYRRLGGSRSGAVRRGSTALETEEILFGWPDIAVLI